MPTTTPPAALRSGSRKIQENSLYPPQPGVRTTGDHRRKAAAAAAAASASPTTTAKTAAKTTAKTAAAATETAAAATTTVKTNPRGHCVKKSHGSDGGAGTVGDGGAETVGDGGAETVSDGGAETLDGGSGTLNGGSGTPTAAQGLLSLDDDDDDDDDDVGQGREMKGVITRLAAMEEYMKKGEEGMKMREEMRMLRDRVEEGEWENSRLKTKVDGLEEVVTALKRELGRDDGNRGQEERGQSSLDGEWKKRMKEVEERMDQRVKDLEMARGGESQTRNGGGESHTRNGGGGSHQRNGGAESHQRNGGGERQQAKVKQRCIIITDSNGWGATPDSIKNHIPRGERDDYDIEVAVAYTVEEAFHRVARRNIDVRGATIIVDNLTNDVRGTSSRQAVSPQELINYVDQLGGKLREAGATAMVVCQLKPMQVTNVTPFNELLDKYLRAQGSGGHGCRTQIRLNYLKSDGFHILPQYDSIIDKTYACALMGLPVPNPTPLDEFVPYHVRCRWEKDWPRIGEGQMRNHGWR